MSTPPRAHLVMVFLLLAPPAARAQSRAGTAELRGQVSAAVAVSATEARGLSERARVTTANLDAATLAVSISGDGDDAARVTIPLQLRSNVGYCLRASQTSPDGSVVRLSAESVRATGKFVHANALAGVRLDAALARARGGPAPFLTVQDRPSPFVLLSGPAVSKAGAFNSPDNALEITLSVEVLPQPAAKPWSTRLTLSAAPCR